MGRRRFRTISSTTLRGWLRALESCPRFVPFVVDLRIAVRSELWMRDHFDQAVDAWLVGAVEGLQ